MILNFIVLNFGHEHRFLGVTPREINQKILNLVYSQVFIMTHGELRWVSFGEEECFQPFLKEVNGGGRSNINKVILIFVEFTGTTKAKL